MSQGENFDDVSQQLRDSLDQRIEQRIAQAQHATEAAIQNLQDQVTQERERAEEMTRRFEETTTALEALRIESQTPSVEDEDNEEARTPTPGTSGQIALQPTQTAAPSAAATVTPAPAPSTAPTAPPRSQVINAENQQVRKDSNPALHKNASLSAQLKRKRFQISEPSTSRSLRAGDWENEATNPDYQDNYQYQPGSAMPTQAGFTFPEYAITRNTQDAISLALASLQHENMPLRFDSNNPEQAEIFVNKTRDVCKKMHLNEAASINVFLGGFNAHVYNRALDWKRDIEREMKTRHFSFEDIIARFLLHYQTSSKTQHIKNQVFEFGKSMMLDKETVLQFSERLRTCIPTEFCESLIPAWRQRLIEAGLDYKDAEMLEPYVTLHAEHILRLAIFLAGVPSTLRQKMNGAELKPETTNIDVYISEATRTDLERLRNYRDRNESQRKILSKYLSGKLSPAEVQENYSSSARTQPRPGQYHVQQNQEKQCLFCKKRGHEIIKCKALKDQMKRSEEGQQNNQQGRNNNNGGYRGSGRGRGRGSYRGNRGGNNFNNQPRVNNVQEEVQQDCGEGGFRELDF